MSRTRWTWIVAGLSITSSWGNGHATTYRALLGALAARGHRVTFLERDMPWYAAHRDEVALPGVRTAFYGSVADLLDRFGAELRAADVVMLGSYVPDGARIGEWLLGYATGVKAFYDMDTPVTLAALDAGAGCDYLRPAQVPRYDLYLSFAGGRTLARLADLGAVRPQPLYCSVDPVAHPHRARASRWDLGYLGTYAPDRQAALDDLMLGVARNRATDRFVVAGPLYPADVAWPDNVERIDHVPPVGHAAFYASQRYTLNLTRADMRRLGHAPSVRLFESASCGATIISDTWDGLDEFLTPDSEVLLASSGEDVEQYLRDIPDAVRLRIGDNARHRILGAHTAGHRAAELERYVAELVAPGTRPSPSEAAADWARPS